MAISMGLSGPIGPTFSSGSSMAMECRGRRVRGGKNTRSRRGVCAAAGSLTDQYRMLRVQPGASEMEVKKAFRQLALQYHPDVCKGSNCGTQFHRINEAYDMVINSLREPEEYTDNQESWQGSNNNWSMNDDDQMRGMDDSSWDMWEEWMGWEGAGIRDYSSHINPYI